VALKDSIVLYVDAPVFLLEATVLAQAGALYIPEPVALAACGDTDCRATVRSIKPLLDESLPGTVRQAMLALHERILRAIQTIGHRETVLHLLYRSDAVPA
jgi:hypothetical protein